MKPPNLNLPDSIKSLYSTDEITQLIEFRKSLHREPELSLKEYATQKKIMTALSTLNLSKVEPIAETGVLAEHPGKNPALPPVIIRGDIDALPIQENTGLDYSSVHPGVMHACGHDVHTSWALASAILINKNPAEGPIRFIFQPAEEIAKGALKIIEESGLKNAKAIIGAHVDRNYPTPTIIAHPGAIASNSDTFTYTIIGKSCHGARPQEGNDPFIGAATIILGIQTIISRQIAPQTKAVISIGKVTGGHSHNIIPEKATITGTIRSFSEETRQLLHTKLNQLCRMGESFDLKISCTIKTGAPSIINNERILNLATIEGNKLVDEFCQPLNTPNFGAEDFGYYLKKIPGCFLRIGCRAENEKIIPAHNNQFFANHESIFVGGAILSNLAAQLSKEIVVPNSPF